MVKMKPGLSLGSVMGCKPWFIRLTIHTATGSTFVTDMQSTILVSDLMTITVLSPGIQKFLPYILIKVDGGQGPAGPLTLRISQFLAEQLQWKLDD